MRGKTGPFHALAMKSQNPTLKSLFEGEKVYRVPLYQRLYVWNETDQWGPLWEDITSIAVKVAEATGGAAGEEITPHFFGALVLKKSEDPTPQESSVWRVIDGQQRLTTTQLAIAAVADELTARREDTALAAQLRELVENPPYAWPDRRYKMRHGGNNYARFADVMSAGGDEDNIAALGGPMARCYLFFRRSARTWLQEDPARHTAAALTATLRTKLQTVAIYLEAEEPEHLIFETLNARGAALTEWDKTRNYLFYRIGDEQQDDFFKKYLERFDDGWWRAVSGRGQDARPRTDRFVDYWLESRLRRPVARSRVFREFKDETERRSADELLADIKSLTSDGEYYRRFESDSDRGDDFEALFHERRRWMDLGSFWPFLFGLRKSNPDPVAFRSVLSTLESWFTRRWTWGHRASGYPDRALELLDFVSGEANSTNVAGKIIDRFATIKDRSGRWPTDDEVKMVVSGSWFSARLRRLVLEAVERHLTPGTAERAIPRHGELQVEHLMPVAWKPGAWPLEDNSAEAKTQRDEWIQTLGNLTLIHGKVNQKMSNASWAVKKERILENSNLFLNKELLKRAPEEWNEEAISERGKWMAERVCEIWPHADALRRRLGRE